ncbi:two-component sensor histidine kinase [Constrictibacter sp. MBR-5]|jgi:two-component sensor histidine kinase
MIPGMASLAHRQADDVFITDELNTRAPGRVDSLKEKQALQDLAGRMSSWPEEVLPRFVELAMEMTEGSSAGLSLYEEEPAPGVFRWRWLQGLLSPFEGTTVPRDFSPCGVALDRNDIVLCAHPERVYNWIAEAGLTIPEALLVPLYLGGTVPLGTLWIIGRGPRHFDRGHARAMKELASFVDIALRMVRTEERLQQALDAQQMLAREMSHRIKNLFAMTNGLLRLSAHAASDKDELVQLMSGRLQALATAHALVRPAFRGPVRGDRDHAGAAKAAGHDLDTLIRTIVSPYERSGTEQGSRFAIAGPGVSCGEQSSNGMALVLHELATNAAKYGALTTEHGRIAVDWRLSEGKLALQWEETGGRPIEAEPASTGFGGSLVRTIVQHQFDGTLSYDWRGDGITVRIAVPADRLSA